MVAEVFAGIGALKTAFDIARGLKDIDDATRRNAAVIELQEKILGAQSSQAALVERVGELEKEVSRLKAWDTDKQRYALTKLRDGVFAYALKSADDNGEPSHYLCVNCYQSGHKSVLQKEKWPPVSVVLVCHDC